MTRDMRWKRKAALVVVAALTVGAGLAYAGTGGAAVPAQAENTCNETGDGWQPKVDNVNQPSVTVTAPEGFLISAYCVKAGPEAVIVTVDPPQKTVTIAPGQDVSHYQIKLVEETPPPNGTVPPQNGTVPPPKQQPPPPGARTAPPAAAARPAAPGAAAAVVSQPRTAG
jgi:hypothetical protein